MDCSSCGRSNRDGVRFCTGCGAPLAARCQVCGVELNGDDRFCGGCGADAGAAASPTAEGARKVVTVVFADLAGSTPLHERLDAEATHTLMARYYDAMRGAVDANRGTVVKLLGDGVMAAFGVPNVEEDDALRAVRAAAAMQRAFAELATGLPELAGEFGLRVGVNTGEVVVSAGDDDIVGDPVNVAARLQQHASTGEVVIGDATARLLQGAVTLAPAGEVTLKGRTERVRTFRLVSLDRPVAARTTRLVGRDAELRRLVGVFDDAVATGSARLAVVLGSPGLGKTRLLGELTARVGPEAIVLAGRCDTAGSSTFAPLAEALRDIAGLTEGAPAEAVRHAVETRLPPDEPDRDRVVAGITGLLGGGSTASPEETFWAVRRLLAGLSRVGPVVLVLDDLHWAEPLLLDLVEHVVEWSRDVPLLVLGAARPELRDARSSLVAPGGPASDVVVLDGLDAGAATQLAADLLDASELPAALAGRLLAVSEGNPLFLRELIRMLVDDGLLVSEGGKWVAAAGLADLDMPPTIHALLAARLERLRREHRAVIERAAVVGKQFTRAALAALVPAELRPELDAHLEALRRTELIEPDGSWFLGDPVLRFHHALIRDAAYRRLLKGTRAELHEKYADWLTARAGEAAAEHEEALGWHLEQAHSHLTELGSVDEHTRSLGRRAAAHLLAAGRRALDRDDLQAAAGLLGRALERLDRAAPERADLLLDRCEALLGTGDVAGARTAVDELEVAIDGSDRLRAWHTTFAAHLAVLTDPTRLRETADIVAAAAEQMTAAGDLFGQAKAHFVHAMALARLGQIAACEAALDRALAAARTAGDRRRANAVLAGAPLAALWGPSPVTRASGRCLDVVRVLRITAGAPAVEAVALRCQAVLEALRGRGDAARRMIGSARRTLEELGLAHRLLETEVFAGHIELLAGDATAAESHLRPAYDDLRSRGLGGEAAWAAALLARAMLLAGRVDEAEALGHDAEELAGDELKASIAWRGVRAEVAARRGDFATALRLAREAVELASGTDALLDHADARLTLAAVHRLAGDDASADTEARRAAELYETKGATILAERARAGLDDSSAGGGVSPTATEARRRVPPNLATLNRERMGEAFAAHDERVIADLVADNATFHRWETPVVLGAADHRAMLIRLSAEEGGGYADITPLATLGDRLALDRTRYDFGGASTSGIGASSSEFHTVLEVDGDARATWTLVLPATRLGDGVVALYERYAEGAPESERERAAAVARSVAALVGPAEIASYREAVAPEASSVDHRPAGVPPRHGVEGVLTGMSVLLERARDVNTSVGDVVALRPDALAFEWVISGTDYEGGGPFEVNYLQLFAFDDDGLLHLAERFPIEDRGAALARFDLFAGSSDDPFANAATRTSDRFLEAWRARDWAAVVANASPLWRSVDRRPLMAEQLSFDTAMANTRLAFDLDESVWTETVIATRGARLALCLAMLHMRDQSIETSELTWLFIRRADDEGLLDLTVSFDPDDLDAAFEELDRLYLEGEAAPHAEVVESLRTYVAAVSAGRRQDFAPVIADDFILTDRRFSGYSLTREQFLASRSVGDESLWNTAMRVEHVLRLSASAGLVTLRLTGSFEDGGDVESQRVVVLTHDGRQFRSFEMFDPDGAAAAFARFDELTSAPQFANAVTLAFDALMAAWQARDWDRVVAMFSPRIELLDRRPIISADHDPEAFVANVRWLFDGGVEWRNELLATRGDRLALYAQTLEKRGENAFAVDQLGVLEADEAGRQLRVVVFDAADLDAAYEELDDRFEAGEAAPFAERWAWLRRFAATYGNADLALVESALRADFVLEDHRPIGWGRLDKAGYLEQLRVLRHESPGAVLRAEHVVGQSARGTLAVGRLSGDWERVSFETPVVMLIEFDAEGPMARIDLYGVDQLDPARARFAELEPPPVVANLATRAMDDYIGDWNARDWDRVVASMSPESHVLDRRSVVNMDWDADTFLANTRLLFDGGSVWGSALLATRGERLALFRLTLEKEGEGAFLFDCLSVNEVDADGRWTRVVNFDTDALDAAYKELEARHQAPEGPPRFENAATRANARFMQAWRSRDWKAMVAGFASAYVNEDRRALMRVTVAFDDYIAMTRRMFDLDMWHAEDEVLATRGERLSLHRLRSHGSVGDIGPSEAEMLEVTEVDGDGLLVAGVHFDPDDLDAAYEELDDRFGAGEAAGSPRVWQSMRELARMGRARPDAGGTPFAADAVIEDHRRMGWGVLGLDGFLDMMRATHRLAPDVDSRMLHVLAIGGHGVLAVSTTFGSTDGAPFELPFVSVQHADDAGKTREFHIYSVDQLGEARAHYESLASAAPLVRPNRALQVALSVVEARRAGDWERHERLVAPTMVSDDRRALLRATFGRDEFLAVERLVGDTEFEPNLAATAGDRLLLHEVVWHAGRAGSPSEIEYLCLVETDAEDRLAAMVLFDLDDRAAAFEELYRRYWEGEGKPYAESLAPIRRLRDAYVARDWDGYRATLADALEVVNHRRPAIDVVEDADAFVGSQRALADLATDASSEPLAILAVDHHGRVMLRRAFGTGEEGAEFENLWVDVSTVANGKVERLEQFEPEDVALALARFEELRPDA